MASPLPPRSLDQHDLTPLAGKGHCAAGLLDGPLARLRLRRRAAHPQAARPDPIPPSALERQHRADIEKR